MKFFILLVWLFSFKAFAYDLDRWDQETMTFEQDYRFLPVAATGCDRLVPNHIDVIARSEELIIPLLQKKKLQITPFEIVGLERNIRIRYSNLKETIAKLSSPECGKNQEAELLGLYDFHFFKERTFKKRSLKNIFFDFANIQSSELRTFKQDFKKYTDKKFVKRILADNDKAFTELLQSSNPLSDTDIVFENTSRAGIVLSGIRASIISNGARLWGILSDSLKWRKGRLKNNKDAKNLVQDSLRPLSILFEKREFVLSNYTIPGHWGHVAVWLGTKEELIDLGVWEDPFFTAIRKAVEDGKNIMEIRKKGVEFLSLESFLNLDQFAVISYQGARENIPEIFRNLTEQIGKKYDFNFNGQTLSRITCAELVTFSYGDINWKTSVKVGNLTILPDDIALQGLNGTDFRFELFIIGDNDRKLKVLDVDDFAKTLPKQK